MSVRPRIGITGADRSPDERMVFQAYVDAVQAAGGDAVPLFPGTAHPVVMLDGLDGIVLSGGRDIDPALYGQDAIPGLDVDIDHERDALELPIARAAVERDLPVLGICRGIQTLNVAMGGTLYQDVTLAGLPAGSHQQRTFHPEPPLDASVHVVTAEGASRFRSIAQAERLGVNTFHHQAIARPAPGLVVTAQSAEPGRPPLVEAVEVPGARFVVAVQWHPERMWRRDPACARLFRALVETAAHAGVVQAR